VRTDEHLDLAACALLAIADLLPHRSASILDGMEQGFLAHGALVPAFSPVIHEGDRDWDALAGYHLHGFRNRPHEYHNGGIWPVWLGWLGVAFARHGRVTASGTLHALTVAHLLRLTHFDFEEYFHGETGEALGTAGMAYTATGFVLLDLARQRGPEAWTWMA
jgi:hypothetical protein